MSVPSKHYVPFLVVLGLWLQGPAAGASNVLEEVIVTATKRESALLETIADLRLVMDSMDAMGAGQMAVMAERDCDCERSPSNTASQERICIVRNVVSTQLAEYQSTQKISLSDALEISDRKSIFNNKSVK